MEQSQVNWPETKWLQRGMFIVMRVMLLIALPLEGIQGYGDYHHFYELAWLAVDGGGGLPFFSHWVEFPPAFPFLSILIYLAAGGVAFRYVYLLALVMLGFDLGNFLLFQRLSKRFLTPVNADRAAWLYLLFLMLPAFGWWTFEPMGVFFALLTFEFLLDDKPLKAGIAAGAGLLVKLIPALPLLAGWAKRRWRTAGLATVSAVLIAAAVVAPMVLAGGDFAGASLRAQFSKGSWETVWALIDGNLTTGSYGPIDEHLILDEGVLSRGNPARIPHWIVTLFGAGFGLWLFLRMEKDEHSVLRITTAGWCVLFLWSQGWSPQWLAYLIPFLLLALPTTRGLYLSAGLLFTSLIEWPLLLSRGRFDLLWVTVPLRTVVLLLTTYELARLILRARLDVRGVS